MEELTEEFQDWKRDNGFGGEAQGANHDAHELLMEDAAVHRGKLLTDRQRIWLWNFIEQWDRQQELVGRLAALIERPYA